MKSCDYNDDIHLIIRQLPTIELTFEDKEVFLRVGFKHHREILSKGEDLDELSGLYFIKPPYNIDLT